jgi:signal transduction histidine kinase
MQIVHSEFQDQLVRGLAHRMNNILTLFHGYLGLLLDNQKLDKDTLEGLGRIKDGARAATELMDRTHSLVRPSTVVWREVDLAEMVRILRPVFESMCGPKTKLQLRCPNDLPHIWADMGRVKTAIVEIVRNACEATFAGGGTVTIDLRADEPAPPPSAAQQSISWVSLMVTDTGPGIPEEVMDKVFTPFFSTKKKQNAAGLGLTVALGFVQQHSGIVRLQSQPGLTKCQVLLPSRSDRA